MSGESETAGSSKAAESTSEPDSENISSANYVERASAAATGRESPIATFQALKNSVIERVPGIVAADVNLLAAAAAAASIPLINNNNSSSNNNDSSKISNNNNNNNNNVNPNKRLFECDVCKMSFSNGANMRRHKMRHTGVKPYECRVCQKRFFRKDHLSEHFTTHIKTLPFHCPICNRGFQRQIAMRAHFQNEHVGQHDLVKTCPLCNYRAGTMKSLRVHFFNRHGIDLDNPGSNASSSLLLALEQQQQQQAANLPVNLIQAANIAASVAAFNESAAIAAAANVSGGEGARNHENTTPPMHYLTPHVEISMADAGDCPMRLGSPNSSVSSGLDIQAIVRPKSNPTPPHHSGGVERERERAESASRDRHAFDASITPSISLIPIKQEPSTNDEMSEGSGSGSSLHKTGRQSSSDRVSPNPEQVTDVAGSAPNNFIKVSPLKSLLREDLKRRISARAVRSSSRNANNNNNNNTTRDNSNSNTPTNLSLAGTESLLNLSTTNNSSNGMITSTGESELVITGRKVNLKCLFCNIEFPDQTLYFLHKGCHSESNAWKCNICGEQLNNVYEFNSHLLSKSHQ
ncbi:DNA-binding protein Ikaros [Culicoides brevitarsis]|uniref:DNA-binding protein Ikaros n=1 Tax=Culicoides brevitarsis TaxID=469753 RepID=UPI00307BB2BB